MRGLTLSRGDATLLRGVDWVVRAGESWQVEGGHGAGRSALPSLLAAALAQLSAEVGPRLASGAHRARLRTAAADRVAAAGAAALEGLPSGESASLSGLLPLPQ